MPNKDNLRFWRKKELWIPVLCSIIFFILGSFYTKWVAIDTHKEYLKQTLSNAISELDYNLGISWYKDDKYIETTNIFSELREEALWQVFYNSNQLFPHNKAAIDKIRECLDNIDLINRKVKSQYSLIGFGFNTENCSDKELEQKITKAIEDAETFKLITLHREMITQYNKITRSLLQDVKEYLEQRLKNI